MSNLTNREVAERFIQAWSAGGQHIVDELAAPDLHVFYEHWDAPAHGPDAFKAMLAATIAYFPDMRIAVEELLADGDRVMVRWRYTGTHQSGELFGQPPTGKQVHVSGVTIYRIANGKVLEERGLVDNFGLMAQLQS
jgi:steroid delta-isomerase-like uncharacterized protein